MILIFLIIWGTFKITFWLVKLCFYVMFFPIILPFKLFGRGKKKEKKSQDYEDGFWDGLIVGSLWDD